MIRKYPIEGFENYLEKNKESTSAVHVIISNRTMLKIRFKKKTTTKFDLNPKKGFVLSTK